MTDPKQLPVYLHKQDILDALKENRIIIVESPTGSGKTTQIPLILNEAGYASEKMIGITQPRRIAAVGVCTYIQNQIDDSEYCGYKMRFYDTTTPKTKIKILTDGMLLQEIKTDNTLSEYSVIMVDEAHERSLNIDFILGLLKEVCAVRKDLKVIISSATINTKTFSEFFKDENGNCAPVITIPTRVYNVDVRYYPLKNSSFDLQELTERICQIINSLTLQFKEDPETCLDTLVFLPGELEIKTCLEAIYSYCDYSCLQIYPLYGRLNKEEQELVFTPTEKNKIKIVLTTNVAETSLTIDGIRVVIDSGLARFNFYNQNNFTSSLVTRKISKASALQRTGRSGRTSDGLCYRLYTKEDYNQRQQYTTQEILRTDLSEVVLRMSDLGIYDPEGFPYITKPDKEALVSSIKTLRLIGAIDEKNHLTPTGEVMVKFPLLPRHSRALAYAMKTYPNSIMNVIVCISFLSCKTPFLLPFGQEEEARLAHRKYSSQYGDFISYQYLYRTYSLTGSDEEKDKFCERNYLDRQSMDEILHVSLQLADIVRENGLEVKDVGEHFGKRQVHDIVVSLASGLLQYICTKDKGSVYHTLTADEIYIHPGSAWFTKPPMYLLAGEIVMTTKMYARTVSPIEEEWLKEISPGLLSMLKKSKTREEIQTETKTKNPKKNVLLYGKSYEVFYRTVGKRTCPTAIIPADALPSFVKSYKKASRHPKNIRCTVMLGKAFMCFDDRIQDLVALYPRLDLDASHVLTKVDDKVYFEDNIKDLIPDLKLLMKQSYMPKDRNMIGFVELLHTGSGFFLHINKSWSQAINNTAYSLLCIEEICKDNAFKDAYNKLVRLLG